MKTFGLTPCLEVGQIQNDIKEAILEGNIKNDFDEALAYMVEVGEKLGLEVVERNEKWCLNMKVLNGVKLTDKYRFRWVVWLKGEKPMNIKWALNEPLPTYLWKEAAKLRVG